MSNINKHIRDYLDSYLGMKFSPGFAVLLQGEWGCGKTWFMKNYQKEYEKDNEVDVLYVSLYSLSSIKEIEDQMFQQLHPILSSKKMILAGKILKGILRTSIKIDLDSDTHTTVDAKLPKIDFEEFLKKTENCILVFDDLERCDLKLEHVLGYINSFVEHQGLKVVIIANEDELLKIEKKGNTSYKRIKEKLIGKTFRINYDLDSAYTNFIEQITEPNVKDFIKEKENRNLIISIFKNANYRNLRHLKQSLWDFERFYSSINNKFLSNRELMKELLSFFFAFSFEIKGGEIKPSDIANFKSFSLYDILPEEKKTDYNPTPIQKFFDKYDFIKSYETLLPEKYWREYFDKGYLSEKIISGCLQKSSYCQDENTPEWVKLWHFNELKDEEFDSLLKKVTEQWGKRDFKKPGEILHICGLFLKFSKMELFLKNVKDILTECKKYIDDVKQTGEWRNYGITGQKALEIDQWDGLGYAGNDLEEFQEIYNYLKQKIGESIIENLPEVGRQLLEDLSKDTIKFEKKLPNYSNLPVLKHIDPKAFFKVFFNLSNDEQRNVIFILKRRYKIPEIAINLHEEIQFLENLNSRIKSDAEENKGMVSGYLLTKLSNHLSDTIIQIKNITNGR